MTVLLSLHYRYVDATGIHSHAPGEALEVSAAIGAAIEMAQIGCIVVRDQGALFDTHPEAL